MKFFKNFSKMFFALATVFAITIGSVNVIAAGCVNRPSENNGDCEENTVDGVVVYNCVTSWAFHDCVKGEGC